MTSAPPTDYDRAILECPFCDYNAERRTFEELRRTDAMRKGGWGLAYRCPQCHRIMVPPDE